MATVTESSTEEVIEYEDYIDQQIATTSFHVKTVDLMSGLILLVVAVLGILFAVVLVDHWVVGLNFAARVASLVTVIASGIGLIVWKVLPPLFRAVNPDYSAQTVERSFPTLKNGLINFLFFRDQPEQLKESVYEGMKAQAATDLAEIPIDSAVDRTPIIRLGYALVAIATLWVGYLLLSPKSPVQTLQRVLAPWSDIRRPSKVDIFAVTPGDADVFRGQTIDVKAKIAGLKEEEMPAIELSTLDGRLLNQRLPMNPDGVAGHFAGTLTLGDQGIEQDVEYRVVAGDATSASYRIRAIESPHIVVDHIEYDFPPYTGQPNEVVQGDGNIRAIEGTRVTIHGKANQPIRRGHAELLPVVDPAIPPSERPASKQATLSVDGDNRELGEVRLTLRLDEKKKSRKQLYRGYRLHFRNEDDLASVDAIEHSLEVVPDLRPIVQILTPSKRTIELPENGWHKIEVRALDPDFQLTQVHLAAQANKKSFLRKNLYLAKTATTGHTGQFIASYRFIPREHGLKAGDVVEYRALAKDNRHSALQRKLDPNLTKSASQFIRIVAADPLAEEPPNPEELVNKQKNQPDQNQPEEENQDPRDPGERRNPDGDNEREANDPQEKKTESNPESGETENSNGENQPEQQQPGQEQRQGGEDEQGRDQAAEQQEGAQGGQQEEQQRGQQEQEGQDADSGTLDRSSDPSNDAEQRDSNAGAPGESQGESTEQQKPGENGGDREPNGRQNESGTGGQGEQTNPTGERNQDSENQSQGEGNDGGGNERRPDAGDARETPDDEPLPSTGERDGEVVERIRRHMEENGDNSQSQPQQTGEKPTGEKQTGEKQSGEKQSGEKQSGEKQSGEKQSGEKQSGEKQSGDERAGQRKAGDQQDGSQTKQPGDQSDTQEGSDQKRDGGQPGESANEADGNSTEQNSADSTGQQGGSKPSDKPQQPQQGLPDDNVGEQEHGSGESGSPDNPGDRASDNGKPNQPKTEQNQSGQNKGKPNPNQPGESSGPEQGNQTSDSSSQSKDGKPGQKSESNSKRPRQPGGSQQGQSQGNNHGDGQLEGGDQGDDANLEYAREATDLVLEYLRDQKNKPDRKLLDKLGWDQEDVQKFVRRWDEMKRKAGNDGAQPGTGQKELDDVLRGMGLQAPQKQLRTASDRNDAQRNDRNTGRRTRVPANQRDWFRAFQKAMQGE